VGGLDLVKDLFGSLIFNEDWLAQNRENAFKDEPYQPLTPDDGHYRLLRDCRGADWQLPYAELELPVLVITGLQDDMFLNLDDVASYAGRLPQLQRRVDFPNAGHMVPVERPQAFTEALLTFAEDLAN
jgi:pimeloyl-ACP methyl ester carboxylesterase